MILCILSANKFSFELHPNSNRSRKQHEFLKFLIPLLFGAYSWIEQDWKVFQSHRLRNEWQNKSLLTLFVIFLWKKKHTLNLMNLWKMGSKINETWSCGFFFIRDAFEKQTNLQTIQSFHIGQYLKTHIRIPYLQKSSLSVSSLWIRS